MQRQRARENGRCLGDDEGARRDVKDEDVKGESTGGPRLSMEQQGEWRELVVNV